MSHVVSSQPSSTSPYQPTEILDNGKIPPRASATLGASEDRDECCFRADKSQGCFQYYCCNTLAIICEDLRSCTESCCDCCANCLAECCEDDDVKARNRRRTTGYGYGSRYGPSRTYNCYDDDNTWVVGGLQNDDNMGLYRTSSNTNMNELGERFALDCDIRNKSDNQNAVGHHSTGHDNSGRDNNGQDDVDVCHVTSVHHSNSHHDTGHQDNDAGTCDASSNLDSGGGGDSGGGDCGGDSGGGDCGGGGDD